MNLAKIAFTPQNISQGIVIVRRMNSLKNIGISGAPKDLLPPAEFWKKYDAGEFGKPAAAKLAYLDPAFQAWMKATQALPAEKQIEAVSKKLMELNPGFDGKVTGLGLKGPPLIVSGVVVQIGIITNNVNDISARASLRWIEGV